MRQRSPIDPNWAPLLINWKRNNTKDKIFIELLLELGCVTCLISSAPANRFWKFLRVTGTQQSHTLAIKTI